MRYQYGPFNSEYALTSIRYAQNEIVFDYDERADPEWAYVAGTPIQQSLRLSAVQMIANEKLVQQYALTYQQSETTRRSLLSSIEECTGTGECKAPTRFQYAELRTGFDEVATDMAGSKVPRASFCLSKS